MSRCFGHIAALAISSVIFFASCGKDGTVVIPRDELARIYAEMLLTDQWVMSTPSIRLIADTSLVYAPILEKYGYDAADYRKSVDKYMDDPERFARILRETVEILDTRLKKLQQRKAEITRLEKLRLEAEKFRPDVNWEEVLPKLKVRRTIALSDSLVYEVDSTGKMSLVFVERADTIYDGVRMVLHEADTAAVDTVTVSVADTLLIEKPDTMQRRTLKGKRLQVAPKYFKVEDDVK